MSLHDEIKGCKCTMSISVLGDGCRYCQPQEHIDRLTEWLSDDRKEAAQLAIASDARIAGLQDQINRDSVELRSLCQARDDARKERDAAKARASELEKDRDYCEKQWNEALATHENIAALKSKIAELERVLREGALLCEWISESPSQRGSINGKAAQVGYSISEILKGQP